MPEIKRIEVLKGPASVLYGFNAFDGVINIITKSPEEMKGATVQVSGGELGTIHTAAIYANRHQQFSYRLSYGHDQNQQWRNRNAPAFRDDKFNVHTEYAHATYDQPNFFVRAFWNRYDISGPVTTTPLLAPFLRLTDRNANPGLNLQGNTYNIEAQRGITLGDTYRLTLGINYRHNTLSSNFIDRFRTEDRLGFSLQTEWNPSEWFQLVGGATYPLSLAFLNFTSFGVVPPDTRVGQYQLLNVRAAYRFWREEVAAGYRREAEVALSLFNALNDNHREHPLGDLLGTRVMGWLTVRL